jgi:hypothetical protein
MGTPKKPDSNKKTTTKTPNQQPSSNKEKKTQVEKKLAQDTEEAGRINIFKETSS